VDQLLQNGADYVNAMALQANRFLDQNSEGQERSDLFQRIENNPEENHFSLDKLAPSIKKEHIGNLQGIGVIEGRTKQERLEIEMALSLNPLFQVIRHNLSNVAWVYYLSKSSFCNIYPWVPTGTMKLGKEVYETVGYQITTPENNPEKELRWSSAYIDFAGKGLMVTCAKPIYWKEQYWGQVGLDVTLDILNKHSRRFQQSTGVSFLVNDYSQTLGVSFLKAY
jgi:hypothetical protein